MSEEAAPTILTFPVRYNPWLQTEHFGSKKFPKPARAF